MVVPRAFPDGGCFSVSIFPLHPSFSHSLSLSLVPSLALVLLLSLCYCAVDEIVSDVVYNVLACMLCQRAAFDTRTTRGVFSPGSRALGLTT